MMRKAQDRAGLHGGIGAMQGMKGMAGFGSTLASNKFVRAAVREEVREQISTPHGLILRLFCSSCAVHESHADSEASCCELAQSPP